ncbi:uncharacterized protein CCOS01_13537 [Colletotrichum costaricense]|uniref:Major facilitator superfamily (MFS) profile domain-containing protein n=1 Tax=Colletotrichum costaricense TaxID=1209916 RepID=A0AAJ0DVE9_9PEZI|nr:uncharacterized protein CCOS01_13537 [Colletotrichum costaricense]KAK1515344.1 hypothetical protein CCOS01_13537 [Colletotrichum costaricense]
MARAVSPIQKERCLINMQQLRDGDTALDLAHQPPHNSSSTTFDWDGPDDPDNPRNAPFLVRISTICAITLLAFASAFGGSVISPATETLLQEYNCNYEVGILPLAIYMLGLAFGPLVGAPLSETYGRRAVFVLTTPFFLIFMVSSGFAQSMAVLIICRFFAGVFASSNINNASAVVLDCTSDRYRGTVLQVYYSVPSLAATFAPLVGSFVTRGLSWRWTLWVGAIVATTFYLPVLFTKETYKRKILHDRAKQRGSTDMLSTQSSPGKKIRYFLAVLIQRPLHMLCTEPIVLLVSLFNGFIYGLTYSFVTSIPWIFQTYYSAGPTSESLAFLGATMGTLLANLPLFLLDRYLYQRKLVVVKYAQGDDARLPPEARLPAAMLGSLLLPITLLGGGWTAEYRVHWIVPILFQGLTMMCSLLIYSTASLFMLDAYGPLYGASASGAMMFSRYGMSFVFPLFALRLFKALGVGWASTLLAGMGILLAPTPWLFWKCGEKLRRKSRYEVCV